MMSVAQHLLPPNASPLEQELAGATQTIENIEVELRSLWDPYQCPEAFLPWLAWSLSVDRWDDDWHTDLKRAIIANSMQVHRQRGTRAAVRDALRMVLALADAKVNGEALTDIETLSRYDSSFQIREWWESSGEHALKDKAQAEPLTFSVLLLIGSGVLGGRGILSGQLYRDMRAAIDTVKPLSTRYSLSIGGVRFDAEAAKIGSGLRVRQMARFHVTPKVAVNLSAQMPYISSSLRELRWLSHALSPQIKLQLDSVLPMQMRLRRTALLRAQSAMEVKLQLLASLPMQNRLRSVRQARLSLRATLRLEFEYAAKFNIKTSCLRTIIFTASMGENTDRIEST